MDDEFRQGRFKTHTLNAQENIEKHSKKKKEIQKRVYRMCLYVCSSPLIDHSSLFAVWTIKAAKRHTRNKVTAKWKQFSYFLYCFLFIFFRALFRQSAHGSVLPNRRVNSHKADTVIDALSATDFFFFFFVKNGNNGERKQSKTTK